MIIDFDIHIVVDEVEDVDVVAIDRKT